MSEAIGMLAQEKGLTEEALLHVLVDALAAAYKRRPDAADEVVVEVNPETRRQRNGRYIQPLAFVEQAQRVEHRGVERDRIALKGLRIHSRMELECSVAPAEQAPERFGPVTFGETRAPQHPLLEHDEAFLIAAHEVQRSL